MSHLQELNSDPSEAPDEASSLEQIHGLLAELDAWAKELQQDDSEAYEFERKMYGTPLPPALFHATTREGAAEIARTGLQPRPLIFEDRAAVCLSDTVEYAKFCASQTKGVEPEDLVVLEVTTQGLPRESLRSYLQFPNPKQSGEFLHEVHGEEPIAPDWIYQLTPDEVAAIEESEAAGKGSS